MGIPADVVAKEQSEMRTVQIAKTKDRSIVGQMVDFAKAIPYILPIQDWGPNWRTHLEDQLGDTPCLCGGSSRETVWPLTAARDRLLLRWVSGGTA
jgi:hypothetical protein